MDNDLAAYKRELLKKLFVISERGKLDQHIRKTARRLTRRAVINGEVEGNVIRAEAIFDTCSYIREFAWRALPNGQEMGVTRAAIEAHWGKPQDWNSYCKP